MFPAKVIIYSAYSSPALLLAAMHLLWVSLPLMRKNDSATTFLCFIEGLSSVLAGLQRCVRQDLALFQLTVDVVRSCAYLRHLVRIGSALICAEDQLPGH